MALVRLPIERDGLHCIRLYDEVPVVVASVDHVISAFDEVPLADLAAEQFVLPPPDDLALTTAQLDFGALNAKAAIEVVASGTGVVVVPMSIARLHHRKDVLHRVVPDAPQTTIALAWRTDHDNEMVQTFIGIVRGRSERSSRS
jgi:DNA-binding transcriptional LysR family regulator